MTDEENVGRLDRAWVVLSPPRSGELSSYPIGVHTGRAECRVAVDRDGLRHLLIPAPGENLVADGWSSVLSSVVRALRFDADAVVHVDVWCTEPDLHAEFDDVIDDLLDSVEGSPTPGAVVLAGLARWRRLFRARLFRGLSAQARIGLFAELSVLRSLLMTSKDLPIEVWTGPLGLPHDVEAPHTCLEVKAIGAGSQVTINGVDQLDTHDGRPLELLVLTVAPDPLGTTLTDLIDGVRGLLVDPTGFEQRLRRLGWQVGRGGTDTDPLVIGEVLRVPITATTPRLVPVSLATGSLPAGVSSLTYTVERDALAAHAVPGTLTDIAKAAVS